ncbi:hypothetical protein P153DRAFT_434481 [Dothidotthia symphoricarpi CBS 119687]|uniref:AAA+ ATPase domain-containing protein n=1 Tax=Dothidotthia symphoricarpi CBS 119687 TaxID=1392245 RepID=A0A6A6A1L3_9PLEO|nr:uncharacterized protein P153DRAFT_434481 [Dothidotthia symphoricarpi CBS 119687]KAF2125416.1 hypothetical protein P153DRAFT_434481 [Dothidotthia symphoricarpi CBS 119687]
MDEWVRAQFRASYCDKSGVQFGVLNMAKFRKRLVDQRPQSSTTIDAALARLDLHVCAALCKRFPLDKEGRFQNRSTVLATVKHMRFDMSESAVQAMVESFEQQNIAAVKTTTKPPYTPPTTSLQPGPASATAKPPPSLMCATELRTWIQQQYLSQGFNKLGFIGWKKFHGLLVQQKPNQGQGITALLIELRIPGRPDSLEDPARVEQARSASRKQGGVQLEQSRLQSVQLYKATSTPAPVSVPAKVKPAPTHEDVSVLQTPEPTGPTENDLLARKMRGLDFFVDTQTSTSTASDSEDSCDDMSITQGLHFHLMDQMLADTRNTPDPQGATHGQNRDIRQAPLLSSELITTHSKDLLPQFGLLGSHSDTALDNADTKLFLNSNVPFSAFVCGVQGSGKSHTTACMLENALIPSPHLGQLKSPVSALVFSYGEFSNGGSGFNVSEAAFLSAANRSFPGQCVKNITVLTSPSNPAIRKFYERFPNIEIIPFKLKAKTLDIGTLLTLMAVNEKSDVPLYMAKVESILRNIAMESKAGVFDYDLFKERLALEDFDPKQTNMLEMRLGLLESFLDRAGNIPEPKYRPGEVTIIDLSDPFVTPNTACILFKLALERFMQSSAPAKMVVLDEAHKMSCCPLSSFSADNKILNDSLATLIRLQRHKGARVVISTQEPTVSTDLIALCSVTVIHRFTSPAWYAALKRHINAMDNDRAIMQDIESLRTGEALVYSPNAVLGKNEDGSLIKPTGRLLKLGIRKRVTVDGGESIMAV